MSVAALEPASVRLPLVMPATRAGCATVPRPCPHRGCRFHLASEQSGRQDPRAPSCSLDLADRGGMTLEEIGRTFGVSRERIRQIQARALRHLAAALRRRGLLTRGEADRMPEVVRLLLRRGLAE